MSLLQKCYKMKKEYWLNCRDKFALLGRVMDLLAGDDCSMTIIYPVNKLDLSVFKKLNANIRTEEYSKEFKKFSFIISKDYLKILKEILQHDGLYMKRILEIEIYKDEKLSFLAGDYFHNECISIRSGISEDEIKKMVEDRIIRDYFIRER